MSDTPRNGDDTATDLRGFRRWLDTRFRRPAAIYGLIVFTAFITIDSDDAETAWDLIEGAVPTLLVFFLAHVFAHTLTDHGEHGLGRATWRAVQHASGMLYASIPSTLVLVVGGIRDVPVDDVFRLSMYVALLVLAALGYSAYARRGAHVLVRLVGAAGTALLGFVLIILEYAFH